MALVEWKEEFKVGIASVDHEHRQLIGLINDLHGSLAGRPTKGAISGVLGEIYAEQNQKEKAIAAFQDRKGAFVYRDLYVFAYTMDGICLAHPTKPERVGKNNLGDKDPDGKEFVRERIEIAKRQGKGWQEYKFNNPLTNRVEQKVAYFELVNGVLLVSGAYKK